MTIRLAVLDMAGTTVRDDGTVEWAFEEALRAAGADPEAHRATLRSTMGQSKLAVFRTVLGDEAGAQRANARFEQAYATRVAGGGVQPLPGVETTLAALRGAGVRVCLTTGFSVATQAYLVDVLGWRDQVDLVLAPDPEAGLRGRPAPDLILAAVLRLQLDDVREVAVAGDTTNDLLAGWRAGASIVAGVLTGTHDRATLATAPHTHLLDSVADLPAVVAGGGQAGGSR